MNGDKIQLDGLTPEQIDALNSMLKGVARDASPQKLLALAHGMHEDSWGSVWWPKAERRAWQRDLGRLSRHQGAATQAAAVEELERVGRGLSRWLTGALVAESPESLVGGELAAANARQLELLGAAGAAAKWLEVQLDEIAPAGTGKSSPATCPVSRSARPATARGEGTRQREHSAQPRPSTAPPRAVYFGEPEASTGSARPRAD